MKRIIICSAVLFAATMISAQELKTYSGSFKGGEATYTYYETDDGRIFEGDFHWKGDGARPGEWQREGKIDIVGKFNNNKRDGLWVYTATMNERTEVLKANYIDGIPDGKYEFVRNRFSDKSKDCLSTTKKNGRLNGPVKIECPDVIITGEYTQNTRTGVWEKKFPNGSYYHIVCNGAKLPKESRNVNVDEKCDESFFYDVEDGSKKFVTESPESQLEITLLEISSGLECGHVKFGIEIPKEKPTSNGNTVISQSNSQGTSERALTPEEVKLLYEREKAKKETEQLRVNLERFGFRKKKK